MTAYHEKRPLLSIIVIAYDMPRQALNTLISLAPDYQQGVDADDYEVILVENRSKRNMDAEAIARLPGNFRYFLRDEAGVSPAPAINFGFAQARGRFIGLMIDGARLVTPGVVKYALMAFRMTPDAMVVVPGYHLGENEQQFHLTHGYSEEAEQQLLADIGWPESANGYRLFDISCWSGANPNGYFHPFMESNCLFINAQVFRDIGRADERFDMPGGGALNLYLYRKAAMHPRTQSVMLVGEGSFHQLHGGVTTSEVDGREDLLKRQSDQLCALLGEPFRSPTVEPILLGQAKAPSLRYLERSVQRGMDRVRRCAGRQEDPFTDQALKPEFRLAPVQTPVRIIASRPPASGEGQIMKTLYMPPSIKHFEPLHMVFSTWVDHLPFGYDLVTALRPKMLVELGTHKGLSYFTFCQAMKENDIDGVCYAVDTFEGDAHTDKYDESVFNAVNNHNRQHYHGFSYLMRMFFEDALKHFDDDSIELLHIDGFHTYEAVSADFANWYPKVKPGGIILFHDVMARLQDFGAWKFWDETRGQHETFTFNHGFGLGVLRKPGGDRSNDHPLLKLLFEDAKADDGAGLRSFYVHASKHLENTRKLKRLTQGQPQQQPAS